jgi:hypothetical protein
LLPLLSRLAEDLVLVDQFYDTLGGLLWYHLRCLQFIRDSVTTQPCHIADPAPTQSCSNRYAIPQSCHEQGSPTRTDGTFRSSSASGTCNVSAWEQNSYSIDLAAYSRGSSFNDMTNMRHSDSCSCGNTSSSLLSTTSSTRSSSSAAAAAAADTDEANSQQQWHMPKGVDLQHDHAAARRAVAQGIHSLPYMAEIYPIGGEAPVACLSPFVAPAGPNFRADNMNSVVMSSCEGCRPSGMYWI